MANGIQRSPFGFFGPAKQFLDQVAPDQEFSFTRKKERVEIRQGPFVIVSQKNIEVCVDRRASEKLDDPAFKNALDPFLELVRKAGFLARIVIRDLPAPAPVEPPPSNGKKRVWTFGSGDAASSLLSLAHPSKRAKTD